MTVAEAQRRLAVNGYWTDPGGGEARRWLAEYAARIKGTAAVRRAPATAMSAGETTAAEDPVPPPNPELFSAEDAAVLLARPIRTGWVVIRRQDGTTIFWYARRVDSVLDDLGRAAPGMTVLHALNLHEYTADRAIQAAELDEVSERSFTGVVLSGQMPVAVGEPVPKQASKSMTVDRSASHATRDVEEVAGDEEELSIPPAAATPAPVEVRAYPKLDAPATVVVGIPFDFVVGLSDAPRPDVVASGQLVFKAPAGTSTIPVEVHVVADGFDIQGAWRVPFPVSVIAPTKASVTIRLTAKPQQEPVRLTSLVVHYLLDGVARGSASRHVAVEQQPGMARPPDERGIAWKGSEGPPPTLALGTTATPPDVEVDIAKPDGNRASGRYRCVIRNAHGVPVTDRALEIDLGEDPNTFAKALIDQIRQYGKHPIVNNLLESIGAIVAEKLPREFWDTLREVARKVPGRALTLQLNSAEPYVPWELALVNPPLDTARPRYLAAQVVMGRWILGDSSVASPPAELLSVKAMAIMAGMYSGLGGLRPLPKAQEEAADLTTSYAFMPAVPLNSTLDDLQSLLGAKLQHQFKAVGGVEAVHFAGHGEVDPSRPGDAAIFLSSGQALTPLFFRKSKLGTDHRPFIFFNACMVGTGGQMLGEFGGFPGACLQGGFTALVAPLWAVNDDIAKSVALEFYKAALVKGRGRSVAAVLRDLRAKYDSANPVHSYLAYVYYGNPHLALSN